MFDPQPGVVPTLRAAMMPVPHGNSGDAFEDVHSFVLRVHLNRPRSGQGEARAQYQLEYVNGCTSRRSTSLDEVLAQMRAQIADIFEALGLVESR